MGTLVVLTLSKNTGAYVHDPAGDKALPYKHDASGAALQRRSLEILMLSGQPSPSRKDSSYQMSYVCQ